MSVHSSMQPIPYPLYTAGHIFTCGMLSHSRLQTKPKTEYLMCAVSNCQCSHPLCVRALILLVQISRGNDLLKLKCIFCCRWYNRVFCKRLLIPFASSRKWSKMYSEHRWHCSALGGFHRQDSCFLSPVSSVSCERRMPYYNGFSDWSSWSWSMNMNCGKREGRQLWWQSNVWPQRSTANKKSF